MDNWQAYDGKVSNEQMAEILRLKSDKYTVPGIAHKLGLNEIVVSRVLQQTRQPGLKEPLATATQES